MAEAVTVEDCERFHQRVCERIDCVDAKLDRVVDAEVSQAASLGRTQQHLEGAAKELEQAARTINAQSQVQEWMQGEISKSRSAIHGENWKLVVTLCAALLIVAGLKVGGLL